jgi:hypothetical protein
MQHRANEIIVELIESKDFKKCINKVQPSCIRRDLVSEISLILLETNPDKIILMGDKQQLRFYVVKIIMNLAFSNTSPFYKKFRKNSVLFKENISFDYHDDNGNLDETITKLLNVEDDSEETIIRKNDEERVLAALDNVTDYGTFIDEFNLDAYESQMLKLYIKYGNYRNMQRQTMIPYVSCFNTVRKAIIKIKNNL